MVWDKQAFHGEISEPNRIGHPVGHMFSSFCPMAIRSLTVVGMIAKGIVRPERIPNGGERLAHYG